MRGELRPTRRYWLWQRWRKVGSVLQQANRATLSSKLKNDLKSNGEVLLRRESIINGVLRIAKSAIDRAADNAMKGRFQSIIQIEWMAPVPQGKTARTLSIALESVRAVNSPAASTGVIGAIDTSAVKPASRSLLSASGRPNAAVLSMPFVVAVDRQTSSAIESRLGNQSSGQLYRIGRGQLTASGSRQTLEIFSHLNNDTVITSANSDFEISSGAQMQLLIGVNRN
jgi:hypothetical protein